MRLMSGLQLGSLCLAILFAGLAPMPLSAIDLSPLDRRSSDQQTAARTAASSDDMPLEEPVIDLAVPVEILNPEAAEPSELEKKVAETLEPVSLEEKIQQQVVQDQLEQFGYEIFSKVPTTFAPVEGIPVPPDYIIGPGDSFTIQIFGATDVEYKVVVTREGQLLIPEVGDLQVAGMSFDEAKLAMKEKIAKLRVGVKTVVTLSDLHTIQVMMVGEVARPGAYTVSGLSSLLNTLIATGGIKRTGSLRNIEVRRQGDLIATMDLYQVLLNGVDESNIYLRQGDVVFVPPIGRTAGIAGEVSRPAIYELRDERTVADVLKLAGGLLPTAAPEKSHIERISEQSFKTLVMADLTGAGLQLSIKNGDLLRIFPVLMKMEDVVLLSGHVLSPGGYQWKPGMRVSDLITSSNLLRQSAEYEVAMIQRENPKTKRYEVIYFNLGKVLASADSEENVRLLPRDQLVIFDTFSKRAASVSDIVEKLKRQATPSDPSQIINLLGYHRHPGTYPYEKGLRLLDALSIGGSLQAGTDMHYALLVRKDPRSREIEFIQINPELSLQNPSGDHNPLLMPEDKVYIFNYADKRAALIKEDINILKKQTRYGELSPVVEISGQVLHEGEYPQVPGMRIKDLIAAAGGMQENAFGISANLSRKQMIAGEMTSLDNMDVKLSPSSNSYYSLNTVLQPYDHLILRPKPEWISQPKMVKVSGEIMYPGEYQVDKRETLCGLVQRSGGFTEDAYLFGAVFLRESVRQREQEAMDKIFDELDDQLADLHLSPGFEKDQKLPVNQNAYDTLRIIKQLKRKKARGRLVIDLEKAAAACNEAQDIVLEDGDHLIVPKYADEVTVVGQVYYPSSHLYREDRAALDYVNLSGGTRELAMRDHIYIVQANGEVMTARSGYSGFRWFGPSNVAVTPGSTVYVPLSVDRINDRENFQSWIDLFYKLAISATAVDYLFDK